MIPEASVAYATATWIRFDQSVSDELLRALCGAFAIVATADGELAASEVDAFVQFLRSKQDVFSAVDFRDLESTFRDLGSAILSDPTEGRNLALSYLESVRGQADQCELIKSAAVIAMTADARVRAPERQAVGDVCRALGLPDDGFKADS